MSKSTLALVAIATLFLGALIGAAVVQSGDEAEPPEPAATTATPMTTPVTDGVPVIRFLAAEDVEIEYDEFGSAKPFLSGENFIGGDREWKSEQISVVIAGDAATEYKALMSQGDSLTFHWSVEGGEAYYDMHAHDAAFGEEFFTRYDEGEGTSASGTIIAPYDGQHGWFWLNLEVDPVTITLNVSGFYDKIIEIDLEAEY